MLDLDAPNLAISVYIMFFISGQLWFSVMVFYFCKEKLFWQRVKATLIYGYKDNF